MSDARGEAVAAALGRHYTEDRIDADELSRRLDLAYAGDVDAALAGLPALDPLPERKRRWGRRHGESDAAKPGWVPTKERFMDPTTRRIMRVWIDPSRGERHYVPERHG